MSYQLSNLVWFSDPIWETVIEIDHNKIIDYAYKLKRTNPGHQKNLSQGGWQCFDIIDPDPVYMQLVRSIDRILNDIHISAGFDHRFLSKVQKSWININDRYSYNIKHIHHRSLFSGVYYAKVPSGNCGDIIFHRNNLMVNYLPPYIVKDWNSLTSATVSYKPKIGMLLLFPGWLEHSVTTNLTDEDRISISFDTKFN